VTSSCLVLGGADAHRGEEGPERGVNHRADHQRRGPQVGQSEAISDFRCPCDILSFLSTVGRQRERDGGGVGAFPRRPEHLHGHARQGR
jgi:hypothetical protein